MVYNDENNISFDCNKNLWNSNLMIVYIYDEKTIFFLIDWERYLKWFIIFYVIYWMI